MKEEEKFINFVQSHPEYYKDESNLYLSFLEFLKDKAQTLEQLFQRFPGIASKDMHFILEYLEKIKLIERIPAGNKVFYYATDLARKLLDEYSKTWHDFRF